MSFSSFRLGKRRVQPSFKREIPSTFVPVMRPIPGPVGTASCSTVCLKDAFVHEAPIQFALTEDYCNFPPVFEGQFLKVQWGRAKAPKTSDFQSFVENLEFYHQMWKWGTFGFFSSTVALKRQLLLEVRD